MTVKKFVRIFVWVIVAIGVVTAIVVWRQATQRPEWWDASLPESPPVPASDVGADVEMQITTQMTQERPADDSWTINITEQQASAWLTGRLPDWLLNRSAGVPAAWTRTAIRFTDAELHIVAEVTPKGSSTRYVGVVIQPSIQADGSLRLQSQAATLGRLRTPFSVIADRLKPQLDKLTTQTGSSGEHSQAVQEFIETHGITINPAEFELDDGRKVRITGITIEPGSMRLTCKTTRPPTPAKGSRRSGKPR